MFNLPDPNWFTDSRCDPSKHEERSDRSRRAAATRRVNMFQPAQQQTNNLDQETATPVPIPGVFPDGTILSETMTGTELPPNPTTTVTVPRQMPLYSYPPAGSIYEGPHAAFEPVQIRRELHPFVSENSAQTGEELQPLVSEESTTNVMTRQPEATDSVRTTSSDARRKSEEIRRLKDEMEKLQRTNRDLQLEITTIRSRKSSIASSQASPRAEIHKEKVLPINAPRQVSPPPVTEWVHMDDIQTRGNQGSPRQVLDSALQSSRKERLTQAGLAPSENTILPNPLGQTHRVEQKFASVTFSRGNTMKMIDYEKHPRVNTVRVRSKILGQYMVHYVDKDALFAVIRDKDHPEYEYTETDPPR